MKFLMERISYKGVQGEDTAHGNALVKKAITLHFPYTIRKLFFRTPLDRPWGTPSFLHKWYRVFPGGRAAGVENLPPLNAVVKERVELYIYSPFLDFRGLLQGEIYRVLISP
jgi:hypothetical protein